MKKEAIIILDTILDQVFGQKPARKGKLGITWFGEKKRIREDITIKTLYEVFRYGEEVQYEPDQKLSMIVRKYQDYSVGLICIYHPGDDRYMITNCWVRRWVKKR